jgi:uncharacterized protein with FMN-binding domain
MTGRTVMKNGIRNRIAAAAAASALGLMVSTAAAAQTKTTDAASDKEEFTGRREYAYYGWVQVKAVIANGIIQDIKVLEYPKDNGRSTYINNLAVPYLIKETVGGRSGKVDLISGATFTSVAYTKSLQDALKQAGL